MELTVPANTVENLEGAKCRKQAKYQSLLADLEAHPRIRKMSYSTIEVGSVGHYSPSATQALCEVCPFLTRSQAINILA